ncbi:D-arabinono-1,4-lactone oxidase [Blastocladiella emersonii ATCC 22665]|nr:D-arabinono-1,4-lactone oxidase [Blastocladiella emersonii ATCC 22665]
MSSSANTMLTEGQRITLFKEQLTKEQEANSMLNWAGTRALASKSQVRSPRSVAELQELVRTHRYVRPVGSRLTYEALTSVQSAPDAVMVELSHLRGLVSLDPAAKTATFWAGTTIDEVSATLKEHNLYINCSPGVIGVQTLAGAIGTGTHGQGLGQSFLCDIVTRVEVVRADGSLVAVDGDAHPELLNALRIHLGVLGLVTKVTLEVQPLRVLTCTKATIALPDFRDSFVELNRREEFCKAWWFPDTNLVHVWAASPAGAADRAKYEANGREITDVEAAGAGEDRLASTIYALEQKMAADTCDSGSGRQFETVQRFKKAVSVTGTMQQIYMKGIPVPQINCEIAIPLAKFDASIAALQQWLATTKHSLHYPFIFRCTGASRAWLAPHRGDELCYIGFLVYLAKDGTAKPGSLEMMRELQEVLAPLGGTPHWGKHMCLDLYAWPALFPRLTDFVRLMAAWDPAGKWQNDFTRTMFAPAVKAVAEEEAARAAAQAALMLPAVAPAAEEADEEQKQVVRVRRTPSSSSVDSAVSMSMRARL